MIAAFTGSMVAFLPSRVYLVVPVGAAGAGAAAGPVRRRRLSTSRMVSVSAVAAPAAIRIPAGV